MQPTAINTLASGGAGEIADFGDATIAHAHIARAFAILIDQHAAGENEVENL